MIEEKDDIAAFAVMFFLLGVASVLVGLHVGSRYFPVREMVYRVENNDTDTKEIAREERDSDE